MNKHTYIKGQDKYLYRDGLREVLKELLEEHKIPSSKVSIAINKSDNYLTKFLRGKTKDIPADDLALIGRQFGLTVSEIYAKVEEKKTA